MTIGEQGLLVYCLDIYLNQERIIRSLHQGQQAGKELGVQQRNATQRNATQRNAAQRKAKQSSALSKERVMPVNALLPKVGSRCVCVCVCLCVCRAQDCCG